MFGRGVVAVGVGVAVLWLLSATAHLWTKLIHGQNIDKLGQWGDSFGGLNAVFAAFGFIAVVATLRLQQKQNADARDDQHRQSFDGKFFTLLSLLRETRDSVRFRLSIPHRVETSELDRPEQSGTTAFEDAWKDILFWIKRAENHELDTLMGIYNKQVHERYESNFGAYFRLVYTILKRIEDDKVLDPSEKAAYGNLLRSQLNSFELALIGVNSLSPVSKDMKSLVTEFHILKYVPLRSTRRLVLEAHHDPEAFMGRPEEADS